MQLLSIDAATAPHANLKCDWRQIHCSFPYPSVSISTDLLFSDTEPSAKNSTFRSWDGDYLERKQYQGSARFGIRNPMVGFITL